MKAASLNDIRKELSSLDPEAMGKVLLKLARYKKENKELLSYLLFAAHDEHGYVSEVKAELDLLFESLPQGNVYYIKKTLRKILRFINRQIRYSEVPSTEVDLRVYFCLKVNQAGVPLTDGTVLSNLYRQQITKIEKSLSKLPEDLRFDYDADLQKIDTRRINRG